VDILCSAVPYSSRLYLSRVTICCCAASPTVGRTIKESYQCDAISSMVQLNKSHFSKMHTFRLEVGITVLFIVWGSSVWLHHNTCLPLGYPQHSHREISLMFSLLHLYAYLQWQPGPDGYVHWYTDGKFRFGVEQAGLDPYRTQIPQEPSYIIFNTAISTSWGFPNPPPGCTEYDCKTEAGRCGVNPGFCKTLPAEFKVAHVRVYQNKKDGNQTVGCNPRSHPTKRYIAAHPKKYTLAYDPLPLKKVVKGRGHCKKDADCGEGTCSSSGRCRCHSDWTGPHCLVRLLSMYS
jgi:hypothetical protein